MAAALTPPGPGISEALARERAEAVADLVYDLAFVVPETRDRPIDGSVRIHLTLEAPHRLVLDFAQPADRVRAVRVNGADAEVEFADGHILVPAERTVAGANTIAIDFTAGEQALNRQDEFLYTLFVPARARLAFPCFDQPDLKARYRLTLTVPEDWQAVANGAETAAAVRDGARVVTFAETPPLPTYLFAFATGRFSVETAERAGRTYRMFHRETDAARLARNREAIFDLHATALAWLEDYTAIPYPWGKFDFVLIPSFQFGGMEHAGAILYNAERLLLDESATQGQLLGRASVIAHETAHMWFGDLVTMRWFDDVWMKEVFANLMAAKIVNPSFPELNHELRFLLAHHPVAYGVDRTAGTNAVRQTLANLDDAGQLYGPIIYQKAPVVMRQLELLLGEDEFRDGLREYLARHAYGNATWTDLVEILDARTRRDVAEWSRAWVDERGRPAFSVSVQEDARGRFDSVHLRLDEPAGRQLVWPERLRLAFGYEDGVRTIDVDVADRNTFVRGPRGGRRPLYVLPGAGLGYGLFLLDETSLDYLLAHVEEVPDAVTRGAAWIVLWDNLLESRVAPGALVEAAMRALPLEADEQNAELVLGLVERAFWRFLSPEEREDRGPALEALLRAGLADAETESRKAAWFGAYRDTVLSPDGLAWLERVWRREESIPGLRLAESDEITLAMELAVREIAGWDGILQAQEERIENPDRRARFTFVLPALSADPAVRERAFARLRFVENRQREPWVLESLAYLNHPLREAHARRFVRPALELLREIQQTGDIFFPTRWTEATLSGHASPEAAAIVRDFLAGELQYPERLRWTVLHTADDLFRASAIEDR
jgi:aminopeptidase N